MQHIRKIITCSLLTLASSPTFASGFYAGGGIGVSANQFIRNIDSVNNAQDQRLPLQMTGAALNFHVGGRYDSHTWFVLEGEGYYQYDFVTSTMTDNLGPAITNIYHHHKYDEWGINLMPGYKTQSQSIIKFIGGFNYGHFDRSGEELSSLGNNFNKWTYGWNVGLGFENMISPHLSLNVSYIYKLYSKIETTGINFFSAEDTTYNFYSQDYLWSLNYYFRPQYDQKDDVSYLSPFQPNYYVGISLTSDAPQITYDERDVERLHVGPTGVGTNAYIGKLFATKKDNIGVELYGGYSGSNAKFRAASSSQFEFNLQRTWYLGLSVMPGWNINPDNRVYLRAGLEWANFNWEGNEPAANNNAFSELDTGYQGGLGDEIAVAKNLSLRMQYTYTWYHHISKNGNTTTFDFHPWDNNFSFGLTYYLSQ